MFDGAHTSTRGTFPFQVPSSRFVEAKSAKFSVWCQVAGGKLAKFRQGSGALIAACTAAATNFVLPHPGGPCTSCSDPRSGGCENSSAAASPRPGSYIPAMNLAPAASCDGLRSNPNGRIRSSNPLDVSCGSSCGSSSFSSSSRLLGASPSSVSESEANLTCVGPLAPTRSGMNGTFGATCAAATILCCAMTVSSTSAWTTPPWNGGGLLPPNQSATGAAPRFAIPVPIPGPDPGPSGSNARSIRTLAPATIASVGRARLPSRSTSTVPGRRQSSRAAARPPPPRPQALPPPAKSLVASSATQACNPAGIVRPPPPPPWPASLRMTGTDGLRGRARDLASVALASSKAIASCTA